MSGPSFALQVRGLQVSYGAVRAVHGIDLDVSPGSIVAMIGANGAGKTSALRAIGGQARSQGTVHLGGREITGWRAHRIAKAGFVQVPQGRRLFSELTVEENLHVGGWGRSTREREKSLDEAYELFPRLRERAGQSAGSLSGGEQQMVAIARGLVRAPAVLAMDEPSLGLAPLVVKEVFENVKRIQSLGVSVLLVEQNATQAISVSDYVCVLQRGRVVYAGASDELNANLDVLDMYLQ